MSLVAGFDRNTDAHKSICAKRLTHDAFAALRGKPLRNAPILRYRRPDLNDAASSAFARRIWSESERAVNSPGEIYLRCASGKCRWCGGPVSGPVPMSTRGAFFGRPAAAGSTPTIYGRS
jgi:hypothetical protein